MNISGLNSLGFQAATNAAGKPASEKEASASFGDLLGKSDAKSETPASTRQAPTKHTASKFQPKSFSKSKNIKEENPDVQPQAVPTEQISPPIVQAEASAEQTVEANALPSQPTPPSMNGPLNDRALEGPVAPTLVDPSAKTPTLIGAPEENVDSLTRRVVWNDFLRKMKDELGVNADELLSAFSRLTDAELAQSPQQAVTSVIASLGLTGADAQTAKQFFSELVQKTKSRSMGEELAASHRQINLTLMSQRELERKTVQRNIDNLNKSFFDTQRPEAQKSEGMILPEGMVAVPLEQQAAETAAFAKLNGMPAAKAPVMTAFDVPTSMAPQAAAKPVVNTVDELVKQFISPQAPVVTKLNAGEASAVTAPATGVTSAASQSAMVPVDGLNGLLANLASDSDTSEEDAELGSEGSFAGPQGLGENRMANLAGANADFKAELAQATGPAEPVAIPELVDRAELMIKDGGGEMKVTLSPDGLGEVAMRVAVTDGKVSVQMITESDEAKKLIERQLGDLKSQLSHNNLAVDTIKIDTATNLGKQLEQQYHDAQRQQAQQTLEQFRQDHQGWRRSFFEVPSARNYKDQGDAPRDVRAPRQNNKSGGSRRLDLVA